MDPNNLPKFVYLHQNHKYRLKLGFYAAPSNPKIFSKAIRDELHKLKFTYCSDLKGLIMGFGKISSNELIAADIRHCISVAVNVDVFIFRPPVGSTIEAVVNQTSDNHISCLVHSLFNVSIVRPEHQPFNNWSGSKIKKNDKINVKVLSFDLTKKLPHITGEIIDNNKDECNNFNDEQDNSPMKSSSSIKSVNNKSTKNVMKSKEKEDPDGSLNDSESSNEMEQMTFSKTREVFTKTSPLFQGKYKDSKDGQNNSSMKSVSYNNIKNVLKPKEKEDPDSSSNDSENSNEIKHNTLLNIHDVMTKIPPSFKDINTKNVIKPAGKKDTDSTSSDSESFNEMKYITGSKTLNVSTKTSPLFQGKLKNYRNEQDISPIKSVNSNNTENVMKLIEKEDSDSSSSDCESSKKIEHITFSKTSPLFQGKYKDSKDEQENKYLSSIKSISPIKSINYNNTKNIITQIEEDSDSSSSAFQSFDEMKHATPSNIHDEITKISPSFKENNTKNVNKPIEKKDIDSNSSDSESSNEMKHITVSKTHDAFIKTSPLFQDKLKDSRNEQDISPIKSVNNNNTENVMKLIEKEDSDNSSSDCESSKKIENITFSKTSPLFQGKYKDSKDEQENKYLSSIKSISDKNTKNYPKQKEKDDTDSSSSNSESSDETEPIHTFNKKNHVNGPLFSSTPNSEHTVNNIGLGRNKLQEQLRKHLAKNRITKHKTGDFIKSSTKLVKNFNAEKDLKIDDNEFMVDNNKNIDDIDKIKLQNNMLSDSGISDDELRQKKFSIDNSSKCSSLKSKKTLKKNSVKELSAILHLFNSDENNVTKKNLSIDCNADHGIIEEVKNTMCTQQNHDSINLGNVDHGVLNNFKSPRKPIVKFLPELRLSTKYVSHKKKDIIVDNKNKMENELLQNQSNIDSECSNSDIEDDVRSIIDVSHKTSINKQIPNNKDDIPDSTIGITEHIEYTSSSDDEIYSKLRQSVSKKEDNTKTKEQIKNQPFCGMYSSDDESDTSSKLHNTSVLSLNLLQSNTTKNKSINKFETDNCNIINDKLLDKLLDKKPLNIQNKIQHVNKMSTILQSPICSNDKSKLLPSISCENNCKIDLVKQILEEDSTSDDDIESKPLQSNITNKSKILNNKPTDKIPASSALKLNENTNTVLNKDIVNPFINFYTKNTSSSSEDDSSIFKSAKSTKKSCSLAKKNAPSVEKKEDHKNVLINKILSSMNFKEKKTKKKLLAEQINYNPSKNNKPVKTKEPKINELKVKTKNKKDVLEKLIIPVTESKSNELTQNNTLNKNMLLSEISVSTNDSTEDEVDEIDLIKKIIKSQELNKITDESDSIFSNNILTKQHYPNLTEEKINKKSKSIKTSTHLVNKLKKKRPKESKDIHLNCILNSLESSSDGHPPTKKKKKNDSSVIRSTDELKDNYYENIISKSKKKKKDHNLVINSNDKLKDKISDQSLAKSKKKKDHSLVVETNDEFIDKISDQSLSKSKKKNDKKKSKESKDILLNCIINSLESSSDGHPPTKKKKKNDSSVIRSTDELKDNYYENIISKSKKKKKNHSLVINTNDELKDKVSDQSFVKSKKKNDHNLVVETKDELIDKIFDQSISKSKKKKKNHSLVINTNDELKDKVSDQSFVKSKKKNDHNLVVETKDELIDKILDQSVSKSKKKKKDHNLVVEKKDELIDKIYDQIVSKSKKKKKDHNLVLETNNELIDKISDQSLVKSKKKKDHNLVVETKDEVIDKIFDQSLSKSKKKKKDHNLVVETKDELIDKIYDQIVSKSKKKKNDHNLVVETNDELIDKVFDQSLSKSKKKKTKNSDCDILV